MNVRSLRLLTLACFCAVLLSTGGCRTPITIGGGSGSGNDNEQPPGGNPGNEPGTGNNSDVPPPDSVGDVTPGGSGDPNAPQPGPLHFEVTARVRNESNARADVSLRFIRDDDVAHLAFVRVLPGNVTSVGSPRSADAIEVSGMDGAGRALPAAELLFGVDFDADTPAEYLIPASHPTEPPPPPDPVDPASITMLAPAGDIELTLGATLTCQWADEGGEPNAVVRISLGMLEPVLSPTLIPVGPAMTAALDGINDQLAIVLEDLDPGLYGVVGEVSDSRGSTASTAPGKVRVAAPIENAAPTVSILAPTTYTELRNGNMLLIRWRDDDADDNASVRFSLVPSGPAGGSSGGFTLAAPLPEDPDGPNGIDSTQVVIDDVLPGLYDLLARISDGELVGTARQSQVVRVLSEPQNDPPQLVLLDPAVDLEVAVGGSFRVAWSDSDNNDNARISLMLDPDLSLGVLNGNEILLTASIVEDGDGLADATILEVPTGVARGKYRVAGSITDGLSDTITWATGVLHFGVPIIVPPLVILSEPLSILDVRAGGAFDVVLNTADVVPGASVKLFLDNRPFGGNVRADVTPPIVPTNTMVRLPLVVNGSGIPNGAWPRRFQVVAEITVSGTPFTATAPGLVRVRQEVEIVSVAMLNYVCTPQFLVTGGEREFVGIEFAWRGGGFEEREAHAEVQFWLSDNGTIPANGIQDTAHAIVLRAVESPNVIRVVRLEPSELTSNPGSLDDPIGVALARGSYQMLSLVEPQGFGRITSPPHPTALDVCFRFGAVDSR